MTVFKCKMCGGSLEIQNGETVAECTYCGTKQTLPKIGNEERANLYDRANHFRRSNDFDKAMSIYEKILDQDNTDAEAYWSIVLCRYGVEYVEDPVSHKRVPTVNRAQYTSIFLDEDYKEAILNADANQKIIYENEAKSIDEIQKNILAISQNEEPFDVFICYKESDDSGSRTHDSVLANDLYHQLTQEGFKVFFARITLEDKLGTAYEPYIFAALNSSKAMVVLGTKPEYFNAVWVKNEWSRYLTLIRKGDKKILIPAYKDMDPYDLPEEFSNLQAQDMSKLGFMQDLIRGIKKIVAPASPVNAAVEAAPINNAAAEPLLKRAYIFLEDGDFSSAEDYCEKVLDIDPENAKAYFAKLMVKHKIRRTEDIIKIGIPVYDDILFNKALKYADGNYKQELLSYKDSIKDKLEEDEKESKYQTASLLMKKAKARKDMQSAATVFKSIEDYKDSAQLAAKCNVIATTVYSQIENDKLAASNALDTINKMISDYSTKSTNIKNTYDKKTDNLANVGVVLLLVTGIGVWIKFGFVKGLLAALAVVIVYAIIYAIVDKSDDDIDTLSTKYQDNISKICASLTDEQLINIFLEIPENTVIISHVKDVLSTRLSVYNQFLGSPEKLSQELNKFYFKDYPDYTPARDLISNTSREENRLYSTENKYNLDITINTFEAGEIKTTGRNINDILFAINALKETKHIEDGFIIIESSDKGFIQATYDPDSNTFCIDNGNAKASINGSVCFDYNTTIKIFVDYFDGTNTVKNLTWIAI